MKRGAGKSAEDVVQEVVPASLQKLRELADSLKASMPSEEGLEERGQSSPGKIKNRKGLKGEKTKRRTGQADSNALANLPSDFAELQKTVGEKADEYQALCEEHDRMIAEGKREQQDYIRREVQFKSQISRMTELLDKAVLSRGGDEVGMPKIRDMHGKIMAKLGDMQQATRTVMADQEQEMLKLFRSRLFEVEDKLRKTNQRKNAETIGGVPRSWMEKAQKLTRELDHYKEESLRLDAENERLNKESNRLQAEHRSHHDDLSYLDAQMVALKHENRNLMDALEQAAAVSMRNFLQIGAPHVRDEDAAGRRDDENTFVGTPGGDSPVVKEMSVSVKQPSMEELEQAHKHTQKLKETMTRLRKLIDEERKRLREVRTAHVAAVASRTELEGFLRQCLADVKKHISSHRLEALEHVGTGAHADHVREERDRVLELLLSQERVITLLYDKTFPHKSSYTAFGGPRLLSAGGSSAGSTSNLLGNTAGERGVLTAADLDMLMPPTGASPRNDNAGEYGAEDASLAMLNDPMWDELEENNNVT